MTLAHIAILGIFSNAFSMNSAQESRGTDTLTCLSSVGHLLLSDTYAPSSDAIAAISALKILRLKNLGSIILGYLNINSIRNKFDALNVMVSHNLDILMVAETKIDDSFPEEQCYIKGYAEPLAA